MSEISIYQFLTKDESTELVVRLRKIGINARLGAMTSGEGDLDINQVFIEEADLEKANTTIEKYRKVLKSKVLLDKYTCPKCKTKLPHVEYKQITGLLNKLLTMGTKTIKCKKCGYEWYV